MSVLPKAGASIVIPDDDANEADALAGSTVSRTTTPASPPLGGSPNLQLWMTSSFLKLLDRKCDVWEFRTFDDVVLPNGKKRNDPRLAQKFRGTIADLWPRLAELNAKRAGAFVVINKTDGKGQKAANVLKVRAIFVDTDGADPHPLLVLKPHIALLTSSGRWHLYWLVDNCKLSDFRNIQRSLAVKFGTDPSVVDLPRVMRLPGFFHQKNDSFLTTFEPDFMSPKQEPYSLKQITDAFGIAFEGSESCTPSATQNTAAMRYPETPENVVEVHRMLDVIDRDVGRGPERDTGRDEWRGVVWGLLATGWTCAEQMARAFSERGSKWDPAAFENVVRDFRPDGGTGVGTLSHIAREHGYQGSELASVPSEKDTARLENFHAYMPNHSYIHVPTGEFWPAASVDGRLHRVPVGTASNSKATSMPPSRWLDRNRPVTQVTWTPGEPQMLRDRACRDGELTREPGATCFNLYRPPAPMQGGDPSQAGRWIELVHKLYPDEAEHIIAWAAHRVQRPGEKINHALVLGGAQGIGKDTLLQPLVKAVGSWNFSDIAPQQLADSFNTFVKCVVLRINEVHNLGDLTRPQFYEKSKTLITTPPEMIRVNQKYVNEYSVRNCCGVVMTTNYKAGGIYLAPDDRRHFVAWSTCGKDALSPTYWTELWAWYETEGFAHVAALLRAHDLSSFNPKAPPPKTAAFWEIVNAGRAPEDAELAGAIDAMGTPEALTLKQLETAAVADDGFGTWISDRKNRRAIPYRLEQCGYVAVRNETAQDGYWAIEGKRTPVYARADLPERDRKRAAKALADGSTSRRSR